MPKYVYNVITGNGYSTGKMHAKNEAEVRAKLEARGYQVVSVYEADAKS